MPWWLTTIFPALLIWFVIGFLLGLFLMWRRLREANNDFDRRRLEGEAESDRLRLRISALKERDQAANRLEGELVEMRAHKDKLATLQGQLQEAETKAHLVPALERQLTETRERALQADRLEEEVVSLQAKISAKIEAEKAAERAAELTAGAAPPPALPAVDMKAENETLSAELRSTRIELEESRSRTGQLDAELEAALEDRDRLRSEVMRTEQLQLDQAEREAELEGHVASLRRALEQAEAEALRAAASASKPDPANPSGSAPATRPASASGAAPVVARSTNAVGRHDPIAATDDATIAPSDTGANWQAGHTSLGTTGANHRDDLKAINGIGPVMERTLNGFGIQTWEQIAAFTKADIDKVSSAIGSFPGRIERDDWVGGARELLAAGHDPDQETGARPLAGNGHQEQP